jgi:outer membrane protein, heavy metal efflux system
MRLKQGQNNLLQVVHIVSGGTGMNLRIIILLCLTLFSATFCDRAQGRPTAFGPSGGAPEETVSSAFEEPTGVLTLRQALSAVIINNPELAAFSWEVRAREASRLQAGLLPNPEFSVEVENFGGNGTRRESEALESSLRISQLLELGGKRSKRKTLAALDTDLARRDYQSKRLDVLTGAAGSFVDVLAAQHSLALAGEKVLLARDVFSTVSDRVEAGRVSPVEMTKAGVILASARIELDRAERELEKARYRLAASWGSDEPRFEKAAGEFSKIIPPPEIEPLVQSISQNPDLARWEQEIKRNQASLNLERSLRFPDLELGGGIKRYRETEDHAFVVELGVPLPLFDRNQGGVRRALYQLEKTRKEHEHANIRVMNLLAQAHQNLSIAYAEALSLNDNVLRGAQNVFEATREGYTQGKFGYLDMLDAQRILFEARGRQIDALARYHKAALEVERLIGKPVDAFEEGSNNTGETK